MAEEFQGGVCGSMWWTPPLNSCSGGGFSSPCSVAQLGGGYDMASFGWPSETIKGKSNNNPCDDNSLGFPVDMDSTLDILGFGLSPTSSTTDWNQPNLLFNNGSTEGNYDSILQDNLDPRSSYGIGVNSPTMMNSSNFSSNNNTNQDGSPPMSLNNASSNSSGDSCEGGLVTSFPMSSSASFLIQTLFDDMDGSQPEPQSQMMNSNDYGGSLNSSHDQLMSPCSWVESCTTNSTPPIQALHHPPLQLPLNNKLNGGMNMLINGRQVSNGQYNTATALSNIRASLLNSLQSRSRAPTFNSKSHTCANFATKVNKEEVGHESKNNIKSHDQPPPKRARIEAPSPLPTFKVRKEKLGDRITALQQLVSPFGKTDTASVLHEAIEYIRFLHDQVHVLSTPYLKNGAAMQHQQGLEEMKDNKDPKQDLRSRGLCLVPISSTYPMAQETPVDFWTPTFGGTTFT